MATFAARLKKWLSEPQDIVGLATWAGTSAIAVSQALVPGHTVSIPTVVGGAVAGLIALLVPTGGTVASDAGKAAEDIAEAVAAKNAALVPTVISDAAKLVADAEAKPVIPAVSK